MALPKLLAEITIDSTCDVFGYTLGGAQTAPMDADDYDTILEVGIELADKLTDDHADFSVAVSSNGIVTISNSSTAWTVNWGTTDAGLATLLGFGGTETVAGSGPYVLTATKRHRYGWYAPVGPRYGFDPRRIPRRAPELEDGDVDLYASDVTHRYRELSFSYLSEEQLTLGGTDSDGKGSSVNWDSVTFRDFWEYIRDRPFRFYDDCADGTVANVGVEGTDYVTLKRLDEELEARQNDRNSWAYWRVTMPTKVVGS